MSVLICRYLTPQEPPKEIVDLNTNPNEKFAIEKAARFVSMIPYIEDLNMFGKENPDLFCTSQEFFDLGGGDFEEHAILLANYFSYIDQKQNKAYQSFIVLGAGMPNGEMVFVMRKKTIQDGSFELWDPFSGQCYYYENIIETQTFCGCKVGTNSHLQIRPTDPVSPLTQIHTVISNANVYVNIQKSDYPILMDFDFTKQKKWKRFFAEDTLQPTCQSMIIYSNPREQTEVIESRI